MAGESDAPVPMASTVNLSLPKSIRRSIAERSRVGCAPTPREKRRELQGSLTTCLIGQLSGGNSRLTT